MKKRIIIVLTLALLSVAGCSTTPKLEDFSNNPDGMWEEGKKLSEKGEKLIIKGEKTIEKARLLAKEGEALIHAGSDATVRARQDYLAEVAKIGGSSSPKEVEYEAKRLNDIGERWENAIEDVKEGNSMVTKSKKLQSEGQAQISEGRILVEKGSDFIRNSQRMRLNQAFA